MKSYEEVLELLRDFISLVGSLRVKVGGPREDQRKLVKERSDKLLDLMEALAHGSIEYESVNMVLTSYCNAGYTVALTSEKLEQDQRSLIEDCLEVSLRLSEIRRVYLKNRFGNDWQF
jgi:hypothetical protein